MLLLLLCALLSLARAAPSAEVIDPEIGIPGAYEVPVEWEVQAFLDGPPLSLNGTIQEVHAQLVALNPDYDVDFGLEDQEIDLLEARDFSLEKRTDFSGTKVVCSADKFGKASAKRLGEGIRYLRKLKGNPRNGGGPGNCGRSKQPKTLNGWGSIADGAQRVWDICAGRLEYGLASGQIGGQAFHKTNWNVIVRHNNC